MSEMSERTGLLVGEEGIRRLAEASVVLTGAGARSPARGPGPSTPAST